MFVFTARKRILRRLCFHRCLSVHRGGCLPLVRGDVCHTHSPLGRHPRSPTPLGRHPPGRQLLWADTPPVGRHAPLPSASWDTHRHCLVHAGIRSTSGRYTFHWNAFLSYVNPNCRLLSLTIPHGKMLFENSRLQWHTQRSVVKKSVKSLPPCRSQLGNYRSIPLLYNRNPAKKQNTFSWHQNHTFTFNLESRI